MQNSFTRNTLIEVDFLLDVLQPTADGDILDMAVAPGGMLSSLRSGDTW